MERGAVASPTNPSFLLSSSKRGKRPFRKIVPLGRPLFGRMDHHTPVRKPRKTILFTSRLCMCLGLTELSRVCAGGGAVTRLAMAIRGLMDGTVSRAVL